MQKSPCLTSLNRPLRSNALRSPRHALHARYQDPNGDLVADRPQDPSPWRDLATQVFALSPAEDSAIFAEV